MCSKRPESPKDVVKTTTYSVDPDYRLTINAARERARLTGQANTFIVVKALAQPELLVEVEAIAVVDR